jgi:hypothetical protein
MLRKLYKFLGIHYYVLSRKLIKRWNLPKYCSFNGKKYKYEVRFKVTKKYDEDSGKLLSRSVEVKIMAGTYYILHMLMPELIFYKDSYNAICRKNAFHK